MRASPHTRIFPGHLRRRPRSASFHFFSVITKHKKWRPLPGGRHASHAQLSLSTTPGFRSASHTRQVCTSLNAYRRVSHSSGRWAGCHPPPYQEELPVLDGRYCNLERDRAPLPAVGPLGLRLSAFPAPRFQSKSGTGQAHRHALTVRVEPG